MRSILQIDIQNSPGFFNSPLITAERGIRLDGLIFCILQRKVSGFVAVRGGQKGKNILPALNCYIH